MTLAASVELPIGGRLLRDPGAVRDLTGSLAEGLRAHVAAVPAGCPGRQVLLQLDEPSLPTVLAGRVPTESGLGTYRAVDSVDAAAPAAHGRRRGRRAGRWCTAAPRTCRWS